MSQSGNLLYLSGHLPTTFEGEMLVGKLGEHAYAGDCHMSVDEGYQASRLVALNLISTLQVRKAARPDRRDRCNQNQSSSLPQAELGDLEKVVKVVKLFGIVNSADGFIEQHLVLNGVS